MATLSDNSRPGSSWRHLRRDWRHIAALSVVVALASILQGVVSTLDLSFSAIGVMLRIALAALLVVVLVALRRR